MIPRGAVNYEDLHFPIGPPLYDGIDSDSFVVAFPEVEEAGVSISSIIDSQTSNGLDTIENRKIFGGHAQL